MPRACADCSARSSAAGGSPCGLLNNTCDCAAATAATDARRNGERPVSDAATAMPTRCSPIHASAGK